MGNIRILKGMKNLESGSGLIEVDRYLKTL
jgi:hypothetical protein